MNKAVFIKYLPSILSGVAAVGVGVTAVLTAQGHVKARDILDKYEFEEDSEPRDRFVEAAKLTWKEYLPGIISGVVTVACIFGSNHAHLKTEAALAALAGVLGTRLKNMDKEILQKYGKESLEELRERITKKSISERSDKLEEMNKKAEEEENVYYEGFTEQFFWAKESDIKRAELALNKLIQEEGSANLADLLYILTDKTRACLIVEDWTQNMGWYPGDDAFEWNASFTDGSYISLNPTSMDVKGWPVKALQYNIYPTEPGEDYIDIIKGNILPHSYPPAIRPKTDNYPYPVIENKDSIPEDDVLDPAV